MVNLVIRFKEENPRWGYQKITDQIVYLGFKISKSTVKNIRGTDHDILDFCVRELGAFGGGGAVVDQCLGSCSSSSIILLKCSLKISVS